MKRSLALGAFLALACRPPPFDGPAPDAGATSVADGGGAAASCPTSQRSCAHVFAYAGAATSVNVYGSFTSPPWKTPIAMAEDGGGWSASVPLPWGATVQYKLQVNGAAQWIPDPSNPSQVPDGFGGENSELADVSCASWSCPSGGGTGGGATPSDGGAGLGAFDWRDAVAYFAFTDRFVDGDTGNDTPAPQGVEPPEAFQGGDWAGVTQKIDDGYFDSLGVNVLWISPPTLGPTDAWPDDSGHQITGYHGYWPYDFTKPEPHFGSLAELQALVSAAHAHGIRVMLDFAMHHVIQTAPVYAQNPGWFWPLANQGVASCVCGADGGCSWDGVQGTECWFTPYLPAFDYAQQPASDYSVGNAIGWVQATGADALRLDAVKQIDAAWLSALRSAVNAQIHPPSGTPFYLIGETFSGDRTVLAADVNPSRLDGQFDFPLRAQVVSNVLARQGSMQDLDGFLSSNLGYYGSQAIMGNILGNHDVPRAIEFADDTPDWTDPWALGKERAWTNQPQLPIDGAPFERLGVGFAVIFTLPGMPVVYYGDEIGMNGAGDPDNRHMMYWTGYSSAQQALFAEVQRLAQIRAAHPALRRGRRSSLWSSSDVLVYEMSEGNDAVYVALNRSDAPQSASGLPSGPLTDELGGAKAVGPTVQLSPRTAMIFTSG